MQIDGLTVTVIDKNHIQIGKTVLNKVQIQNLIKDMDNFLRIGDQAILVDGSWSLIIKPAGLEHTYGIAMDQPRVEILSIGEYPTDRCGWNDITNNNTLVKILTGKYKDSLVFTRQEFLRAYIF
jgi:hypothetical protein